MKPKPSKKQHTLPLPEGNWVDIDDLVKPGEVKEIWPGMWVNNTVEVLDPPEPIKSINKAKRRKPKKK